MINKKTAAAFALLGMSGAAAFTLSQTAAAQTTVINQQPSGVLSLSAPIWPLGINGTKSAHKR